MGIGVEDEDKRTTWVEDAEWFSNQKAYECARAVYGFMLTEFPQKKSVWLEAIHFEKEHGTSENYESLLQTATERCPKLDVFWLMLAKSLWQRGDPQKAREILFAAFKVVPDAEEIFLAAFKLEYETDNFERARSIMEQARERTKSPRLYIKSARLEWCLKDLAKAEALLKEGLGINDTYDKFYMMLGQLYTQQERFDDARRAFTTVTRKCPNSITSWILLVQFEEQRNMAVKARSDLDMARLKNPKNELLWLEAIRLEVRGGKKDLALSLLARAQQECENSGRLYAEAINLATRHSRRAISVDALSKAPESPYVLLAVCKMMWSERKIAKAREWFNRALKINKDNGDVWAYYNKFEIVHGTPDQQKQVVELCKLAEPRHGELWQSVAKDIKNWRMKTEDVLNTVTKLVEIPR